MRFLDSEREGELYRLRERIDDSERSMDTSIGFENTTEEIESNIYSCILLGINWWKHLKAIYPKIPTEVNRSLLKSLKENNTSELREKFGERPTRADLKSIEAHLGIDLYIMFAGEFSHLGIAYRPERFKRPLDIRFPFTELEDASQNRDRPVVVLQTTINYFHTLGNFYVFPTHLAALNYTNGWKSIWTLIVEKRWPKLEDTAKEKKICDVKRELALGQDEIWSIGDGVFNRLKQKFGVTISIFIGHIINDNKNEKTMIYTTDRWRQNLKFHLNILVAGFKEHEFYEEFKKFTNISYQELMKKPDALPTQYLNKKSKSCQNRSVNLKKEAIQNIFNWQKSGDFIHPTYDSDQDAVDDTDDSDIGDNMSSFIVDDRTTYKRKQIKMPKDVSAFFDSECTTKKTNKHDASSSDPESDEFDCEINGVSIGKMPKFDSKKWDNLTPRKKATPPNVSFSIIQHTDESCAEDIARLEDFASGSEDSDSHEIESSDVTSNPVIDPENELAPAERPISDDDDDQSYSDSDSTISSGPTYKEADEHIINMVNIAPNVFDNQTLCRIIDEKYITDLYICNIKNCLYTHHNKNKMERHKEKCSDETKKTICQRRCGLDLCDIRKQLFNEGFLPSEDYFQKFFISYDIESFMSEGPFSKSTKKYHSAVTIACTTSDGRRQSFWREDMGDAAVYVMVVKFINYLAYERKVMIKTVPECIKEGIHKYEYILNDAEVKSKFGVREQENFRSKLHYLREYMKLKVYSWNGERYDLPMLFPMIISVLHSFGQKDGEKMAKTGGPDVNIIKRGVGYMLVEAHGISFRDFLNYTSPMTLDKLARSCDLDVAKFSKGCWPYEHFTTIEQCEKSEQFTAYPFYRSSMYIKSGKFATELNEMIEQYTVHEGKWDVEDFYPILVELLQLENMNDDVVLKEAFEKGLMKDDNEDGLPFMDSFDYMTQQANKVARFFTYDHEKGCHQCDPTDPVVQDYFRYSVRKYFEGYKLWGNMRQSLSCHSPDKKMNMMKFLLEYNLTDTDLLSACINSIAEKYAEKFNVGIHRDLSISKIAERIAFMMYDQTAPPIYSIPRTEPEFYEDCRKNLYGGMVQVLHRAVCLNGPADYIPKAATNAPDGNPYKCVVSLDFASLYPHVSRGEISCGPGMIFKPRMVPVAAGLRVKTEKRFFVHGMFKG